MEESRICITVLGHERWYTIAIEFFLYMYEFILIMACNVQASV